MRKKGVPGNAKTLNAIRKVIDLVGGSSELARRCDVRAQAIQYWLKIGKVPAERVLQMEKMVKGEVSRHDLRPDIYPIEKKGRI